MFRNDVILQVRIVSKVRRAQKEEGEEQSVALNQKTVLGAYTVIVGPLFKEKKIIRNSFVKRNGTLSEDVDSFYLGSLGLVYSVLIQVLLFRGSANLSRRQQSAA